MIWNRNRLAYLSGITNKRTNISESKTRSPHVKRESLVEAKIRKIIRKEIQRVIQEMEQHHVEKSLLTRNLGMAMGFLGTGFAKNNSTNKAAARTSTMVSFGGPGFM